MKLVRNVFDILIVVLVVIKWWDRSPTAITTTTTTTESWADLLLTQSRLDTLENKVLFVTAPERLLLDLYGERNGA